MDDIERKFRRPTESSKKSCTLAMALLNKLLRSKEARSTTDVGAESVGASSHGVGLSASSGSSIFKHSGVKSIILEFQVDLDDVHRVRKPNETVEGTVTLRLKRDVSNVWIRLSHVGECQLRSGTPKAMTSGSLRSKCSERLFCRSNDIYGSEQQPLDLTSGQHKFPFSCSIPTKNILSSIDFKKGSVKYWVQAELHTRSAPVVIRKQWYQLVVPFDVSQLPKPEIKTVILQSPNSNYSHMNHSRKHLAAGSADHQDATSSLTRRTADSSTITNASTGSCTSSNSGNSCPAENNSNNNNSTNNINNNSSASTSNNNNNNNTNNNNKTVKISVEIPSLGYTVGEDIQVKVKVSHYKHYSHPAGLIATLVRICRVANSANLEQTETFRKDICQSVAPLYTDPDTHDASVMLKLKVPLDTFPTSDVKNKFFTFQYYVEVLANLSKKNQVYTESNRLVGGQRTSDIPTQSEKLSFIPKLIASDHNSAGEDESVTFFQDLINVDRLKRLRNVTGMSIEIVLGTHREIPQQQQQQQESPVAEGVPVAQDNGHVTTNDNAANTSLEEPSSPIDQVYGYLLQQNMSTLPEVTLSESDIAMSYPTDPVPSYSSNFNNFALPTIVDDKQELEQMRLKELESEPPI